MKKIIEIVLCLGLVLGFGGCAAPEQNDIAPAVVSVEEVGSQFNPDPFDESLLQYISSVQDGSYMISPLSFRYALGILLAGASGDTKTELLQALDVSSEAEWEASCLAFNGFSVSLSQTASEQQKNDKNTHTLKIANSVWKRNDIPEDFHADYLERIQKSYAADNYTFTNKNAVKQINSWVKEKTNGFIPELLAKDSVATDFSPVVLMNALYYKDNWVQRFSRNATKNGDFTMADGTVTKKSFMHIEEKYDYYEDESTQLVILPMQSGVYMAYVLGSTENLGEKFAQVSTETVQVAIPKIDLETSFADGQLMDFLKTRGVNKAFDEYQADYSAMLNTPIWVEDIIQKTRLNTDEKGVEAAAVTEIEGEAAPEPDADIKIFTADRPFSFYIYNSVNGITNLIFAGEIVD